MVVGCNMGNALKYQKESQLFSLCNREGSVGDFEREKCHAGIKLQCLRDE